MESASGYGATISSLVSFKLNLIFTDTITIKNKQIILRITIVCPTLRLAILFSRFEFSHTQLKNAEAIIDSSASQAQTLMLENGSLKVNASGKKTKNKKKDKPAIER